MRLKNLRIENFRSFKDQTVTFDNYTCFVGQNGSGKSTVLTALNIFFRNTTAPTDLLNLGEEDFHHRNTDNPIRITLTFGELSEAAKEALKAYVRQGQLVVAAVAEFDPSIQKAMVKQRGARLVMARFAEYFKAIENKAKAPELKKTYEAIRADFPELPAPGSLDAMRSALRDYEEAHPDLCELLEGETQFYGWSKGDNLLRQFIQWVYLPAVKDATSEQDEGKTTALGMLLDRTIRTKVNFSEALGALRSELTSKYKEILEGEQEVLNGLTQTLSERLRVWTHQSANVHLKWHYNEQTSIKISDPLARLSAGEHDFLGEIGRLGHGLQRSLLVSLLQELAESDEQPSETLLLGFEEPELYQHPPQARHMASVLEQLAEKKSQILVTTHSPYFVSAQNFPLVRMVRNSLSQKSSFVSQYTYDAMAKSLADALNEAPRSPTAMMAKVEQIMQPSHNELYFTRVAVLVEGLEDIAFLSTYMGLLGLMGDFRKFGCHFIMASGKANLSRPLAIARGLGIPSFVIFDGDNQNNEKQESLANNKRNNGCIFNLIDMKGQDPVPDAIVWGDSCIAWPATIRDAIRGEIGPEKWDAAAGRVKEKHGYEGTSKDHQKNSLFIAGILEDLWSLGVKSSTLEKACNSILGFAKSTA